MPETPGIESRALAEIGILRQELAELRREQRELSEAVRDLARTFKTLAAHLGIAAEPYGKGSKASASRDVPGFG